MDFSSNYSGNDDDSWERNESEHHEPDRRYASQQVAIDEDMQKTQLIYEQDEISPEDMQVFESENVQLFHELQGLSEEVEQIEKNVVGIAKLQEIFTEKVCCVC